MANYTATARSNYFAVKDEEAFRGALVQLDVEIVHDPKRGFSVFSSGEGGWPSGRFDDEDEWVDIDLADVVAGHLKDGEVAVLVEAGAEKLRYVNGYAVAINNEGERREVSLGDIYGLANELGTSVQSAEY